jgi:hypothetical protein
MRLCHSDLPTEFCGSSSRPTNASLTNVLGVMGCIMSELIALWTTTNLSIWDGVCGGNGGNKIDGRP